MKQIAAIFIVILGHIVLAPQLIAYRLSNQKSSIKADCMQSMNRRSVSLQGYTMVIYILMVDPFYRKMFYHRLGWWSLIFSWYFPGDKTFNPLCEERGGGRYLAHPTSTYRNEKKIGKNLTCRQNTTIGNKYEDGKISCPTIGDNVNVGANVCIIGDITIGNNVTIGAGSVVVKSIPDNCVAVGNPVRIIEFHRNNE